VTSSDEPRSEPSGEDTSETSDEGPRIFREFSGPMPVSDDTRTSIIRRHPTGPIPEPLSDDTRTSIIGPQPDTLQPAVDDDDATHIFRQRPVRIPGQRPPSNATAVMASAVSIISGWATAVVATGLITAWWKTDRLFTFGVAFLSAVFGACTIAGVIMLMLRRRMGVVVTVVAAVLAILIFSGIFIAGAHMAGVVYAFPVLPALTIALAIAPATWKWTKPG
jgi:hypothetical protein